MKGECFSRAICHFDDDGELLRLLSSDGGGEGGAKLSLEIVQLGLEREQRLVNLLLVISVDAGRGEGGDPGEGDQGEAIEDGADIGQQIHGHGELKHKAMYLRSLHKKRKHFDRKHFMAMI